MISVVIFERRETLDLAPEGTFVLVASFSAVTFATGLANATLPDDGWAGERNLVYCS